MSDEKNPYLRRQQRTANLTKSHKRAPKQEREIAALVRGRVTPRSGAGDQKGDVRLKGVARIECKTTKHKSFSVTLDMIEKLEMEAALAGELPVFVIEFCDEQGRKIKDMVVCPSYVLDSLQ